MKKGFNILRNIFIAIYPFISLFCFGYVEDIIEMYAGRTYQNTSTILFVLLYYCSFGALLAFICSSKINSQNKTGRLIGFLIGFILCLLAVFYWWGYYLLNLPAIQIGRIGLFHILNPRMSLLMFGAYSLKLIQTILKKRQRDE